MKNRSKKKQNEKYVKFCPRCKSINVFPEKSTLQILGFLPTRYVCNDCGYAAFSFPCISLANLKKLRKTNL